ncbi:NfeD family protein [Halodesulfovibrio marinisediminis]|uniref:Membrane-bound serine protease (ClpP class) n=1 Tax=Halodesulfovibrio marinisediminis DSM 17456 TaxID=1121457 RepID=A0A1N6EUU8_9BACT|nr:nodulation protein NfeD [Halodesulfovibrio marinisediminis]SIN86815.1 membrane-bound serine protease (ClpP class) [Halodesulfovibrio marinisediminis DSM 17456]
MSHLRSIALISLFAAFLVFFQANTLPAEENSPVETSQNGQNSTVKILHYTIDSGIGPAQVELTESVLRHAGKIGAQFVVMQLDTPGGLVSSMREILKNMLNSPIPVLVWVGPRGARAASAGVFLVAASAFAGMAPQTTMGAASPVDPGGKEIDPTMSKKVINDLVSLVRTVAARHDRNINWYEDAIRSSTTITSERAATARVVEVVAPSIRDFLVQAGNHGIKKLNRTVFFSSTQLEIVQYEPTFRYKVLSWLIDPQVAYLLVLAGVACLFIEFTHAGAMIPGIIGAFSLLLGLYAMSILPTNIAGLLLILFSLVLFALEVTVTSYGLLTIGGVSALLIGSLILFPEEGGHMALPISLIVGTTGAIAAIMGGAAYLAAKALRKKPASGMDVMIGKQVEIVSWKGGSGKVFADGTIWSAKVDPEKYPDGIELENGSLVIVKAIDDLTVTIDVD